MLAQNFKSPTDLGISDAEFSALIKVLGLLEREEVEHFKVGSFAASRGHGSPTGFNMALIKTGTDCGTAACILGWARELAADRDLFRGELASKLEDLFCMGGSHGFRGKFSEEILPAEAAIALRNFLSCGEPRWNDIFQAAE